jgi:F-type H+-transporting ATPase subunit delta
VRRASPAAARRYARALLDLTLEGGDPARLRAELSDAAAALRAHPELLEALTHPGVTPEQRQQIVVSLWGESGVSKMFLRLLRLLAERGRIELLPAIADAFGLLWNAHRGVVPAQAVSAIELDDAQATALASAIKSATGRELELETRVDPGVLGGLRVLMGGRTYDGTVRARLKALRDRLSGDAATS